MEEMKAETQKKDKEHSETLEALQQELDSLEKERRELKEKLRKITILDSVINRPSLNNQESFNSSSNVEIPSFKTQTSNSIDSSALVQEINILKCQNKLLQKSLNEAKQAYVNKLIDNLPNKLPCNQISVVVNNDQLEEKQKNFVQLSKKSNDLLKVKKNLKISPNDFF